MPNDRISKVNELIKNQISLELLDLFPDSIVSITAVKVSKDLSYAKVWVAALHDVDKIVKQCQIKTHLIRREIAKKVSLGKTPSLHFVADKTDGQAEKIEHILEKLKKDEI